MKRENFDHVLTFLPYFEDEATEKFQFSGESVAGPYLYEPKIKEFIQALHEEDVVLDFDWPSWGPVAVEYLQERDKIYSADLEAIQKLFTIIVQAEKMTYGVLAEMIKKGVITDLLLRLEKLRDRATEI